MFSNRAVVQRFQRRTIAATASVAAALACTITADAGSIGTGGPGTGTSGPGPGVSGTATAAGGAPGIVLHEIHTQPQVPQADTIVTYVTARQVRVSHAGGHTLVDLVTDRIVFLDPAARTFRAMSLRQWEARLQEAVTLGGATGAVPDTAGGDSASVSDRFEPVGGGVEIAGYLCDRYHHYGTRTLLGMEETVEQQIWVTHALEMPAGAYDTYQRALGSIESIGSRALLRRPPGVIMGVETRTQRAGARPGAALDIERTTVFRVERTRLPDSLFAIPRGYVQATDPELQRPEMH